MQAYENIVAWPGTNGIYAIAQNRADSPCVACITDIQINNNRIFSSASLSSNGNLMAIGWQQHGYSGYNWFTAANRLSGTGNGFWFDTPESSSGPYRYFCNANYRRLAEFDATMCDANSFMVTPADGVNFLNSRNVPSSPPSLDVSYPPDPARTPYHSGGNVPSQPPQSPQPPASSDPPGPGAPLQFFTLDAPVRLLDTRNYPAVFSNGGMFVAGESRRYQVSGKAGTSVPITAQGIVTTLQAVNSVASKTSRNDSSYSLICYFYVRWVCNGLAC